MTEYALYHGDKFVAIGTAEELAEVQDVKPDTIKFYASPSYYNRRKNPEKGIVVVRLDDE